MKGLDYKLRFALHKLKHICNYVEATKNNWNTTEITINLLAKPVTKQ